MRLASAGPNDLAGVILTSIAVYLFTSALVLASATFAYEFVPLCGEHPSARRQELVSTFAAWDGEWYLRIAEKGYDYDPHNQSSVAFFPLYPLAIRLVMALTGLGAAWSGVLAANIFLCGDFVLLGLYVRNRWPEASAAQREFTLLMFGLFPMSFYFRMTYSESTFLFFVLGAMYAMNRRAPAVLVALIIGAATAARPVGVVVTPALLLYLYERQGDWKRTAFDGAWLLPLACWGIIAYIGYQAVAFSEPLAFVRTQANWTERERTTTARHLYDLLTLEPLRAVYDEDSSAFWGGVPPRSNPLFNMKFANPIFFAATIVLLIGYRKLLTPRELLLAMLLLAVPYYLQGHRTGMMSQGRYVAVVFPLYLVLAQRLTRGSPLIAGLAIACGTLLLAFYTMMFVSWYWYY